MTKMNFARLGSASALHSSDPIGTPLNPGFTPRKDKFPRRLVLPKSVLHANLDHPSRSFGQKPLNFILWNHDVVGAVRLDRNWATVLNTAKREST